MAGGTRPPVPTAYVRSRVERRALGMSGPVWTMALWFAITAIVLLCVVGGSLEHVDSLGRQLIAAGYCVAVVVVLAVLRDRTPTWFLYVQVGVSMLIVAWLITADPGFDGSVSLAMSFIPLAVYMAWWMPPWHAAVGATLGCAMLYGAFAVSGQFPDLLVPWLTVTATALGLGAGFAMLVSQLRAHVLVDPLTGLLNREGMNAILGSVPRSASDRPARDLVVIDLDGFKAVNDRDGHLAGDEMLRDFAMAVRHAVRPGDFAFRSGGDEFVLVLVVADSGGTAAVLDRLRGSSPLAWSSGATSWAPGEPFDAAFARADALMYDAKPRRS